MPLWSVSDNVAHQYCSFPHHVGIAVRDRPLSAAAGAGLLWLLMAVSGGHSIAITGVTQAVLLKHCIHIAQGHGFLQEQHWQGLALIQL